MEKKIEIFKNLKLKNWLICLFGVLFIGLFPPIVIAQTSSNDNYQIDVEDIDINPQKTSFPTPQKSTNLSPILTINEDPKSIIDNSFLSIFLDNTLLDFGPLGPGNPVTRTVELSVKTNTGYQVVSYENHSPTNKKNASVPDTTCEDGQCTETQESLWKNTLTYGFGFRCDNLMDSDCIGFTQDNFYRQIANLSRKEHPASALSGVGSIDEKKAKLTFKINSSGTQEPGSYTNNIIIIALPDF